MASDYPATLDGDKPLTLTPNNRVTRGKPFGGTSGLPRPDTDSNSWLNLVPFRLERKGARDGPGPTGRDAPGSDGPIRLGVDRNEVVVGKGVPDI
jgi:hypothetical protein